MFVFEGNGDVAGETVAKSRPGLFSLGDGDGGVFRFDAGSGGARFVLIQGRSIGESIVRHGPFFMNTRAELAEAFADYQAGKLVRSGARVNA